MGKTCRMFLCKFSPWNMLNNNLSRNLYSPKILGSCVCRGIDVMKLKNNSFGDGTTDIKSNKQNVKEKPKHSKTSDTKKFSTKVVEPTLEWERRLKIQSVVGIHLGQKSLYWAKIDRLGNVLEWKYEELFPAAVIGRKILLPKIFALMDCVSENIPFSDIFVLETSNSGTLNSMFSPPAISNAILRSQMMAVLFTILNLRIENEENSEEYYHKVFILKSRVVSRFFNLLIGSERVSSLELVDSMLGLKGSSPSWSTPEKTKVNGENVPNTDYSPKQPTPVYSPVHASSSIIGSYCALEAVEREAMSQALLITKAFYDLVVFKD